MLLHQIICAIQQVPYNENGSYSEHGSAWKYHTKASKFTPFRRAEDPDKHIELFIKDIMKGDANMIKFGIFYFYDAELVPPKFSIYFFQAQIVTRCKTVSNTCVFDVLIAIKLPNVG